MWEEVVQTSHTLSHTNLSTCVSPNSTNHIHTHCCTALHTASHRFYYELQWHGDARDRVLLFFWNHACKSNDTCICVKRYLLQWFRNIPVKEAYLFVLNLCRTTSHWGEDPSTRHTQLQLHNLKHMKIQRWTSSAFFYTFFKSFHTFAHWLLTTSFRAVTEILLKKSFVIWRDLPESCFHTGKPNKPQDQEFQVS